LTPIIRKYRAETISDVSGSSIPGIVSTLACSAAMASKLRFHWSSS